MAESFDRRVVPEPILRFVRSCQARVPCQFGGSAVLSGVYLAHRLSRDVDLVCHAREEGARARAQHTRQVALLAAEVAHAGAEVQPRHQGLGVVARDVEARGARVRGHLRDAAAARQATFGFSHGPRQTLFVAPVALLSAVFLPSATMHDLMKGVPLFRGRQGSRLQAEAIVAAMIRYELPEVFQ